MASLVNYWPMTEGAFHCLIDEERTLAFKSAIEHAVRPGDIVVDAGSGTGILAMFAADAGAGKVYALELDESNTRVLQGIFTDNGYGECIEVIQGDATTLTLPENVDVIVCEMIATALIDELQVPVMNRGCKNFCVNGHSAGNCRHYARSRNDRKQRTDRQPAGRLQET